MAQEASPRARDQGQNLRRVLGPGTATGLVIAGMIGAGIFTTSGLIAPQLGSGHTLLLVWLISGVLALMGGLSYAELGASLPEAGAEYAYCRRAFGNTVGYLTGMVSTFVGFGVSLAGVAIPFGAYAQRLWPGVDDRAAGCLAIALLSAVHCVGVKQGARFNDLAALVKLLLMLAFVAWGLSAAPTAAPSPLQAPDPGVFSGAFAGALVVVSFAYMGWNMACYLGGEIVDPGRNIPRAVLVGTGTVTLLYVLVNLVFLRAAAPHEMVGADGQGLRELGAFAAERLFGENTATAFSLLILWLLLSTISAMTMGGARLLFAMARRGELPRPLGALNARDAPVGALIFQAILASLIVCFADLSALYTYVGVLMTFSAALTCLALIVLRRREPALERPYRVPLYPLPPLLFIGLTACMIVSAVRDAPTCLAFSGLTLLAILGLRPLLRVRA